MIFKKKIAVSLVTSVAFASAAWGYNKYNHQNILALNAPAASSLFKTANDTTAIFCRPLPV